jgi:hypothetical protein
MPLSLETQFLLETLRSFIGGDLGSLRLDTAEQLDSKRLLSAAQFHRVAPLAYKTLSKLNPKHFPAPIVEQFRPSVNAIGLRSLQLAAEMLRLLSLLKAEGIPTVAFKGPVLSLQAYGDPFMRQFDDIDLLVPLPEFDRTRSFLCSHGYTDNGEVTHACNLFHYERRTAVDLHRWVLGPLGFSGSTWVTMDSESLLARSVDLNFQEHRIRAMQTEDLLLALCIHGVKHGWERWIWLFDIAALIARQPLLDWDQLTKRSQEYAITEPVYLSLRLSETVCGSALPPGALKGLGVRPAIEKLIPALHSAVVQDPNVLRSNLRKYLLPLQTLTKGSDKRNYLLRFLKDRITPTNADHNAIDLPPYLEFMYFAIRPLRLLYRYGSNMAGYVTLRLRWNRNPETRGK